VSAPYYVAGFLRSAPGGTWQPRFHRPVRHVVSCNELGAAMAAAVHLVAPLPLLSQAAAVVDLDGNGLLHPHWVPAVCDRRRSTEYRLDNDLDACPVRTASASLPLRTGHCTDRLLRARLAESCLGVAGTLSLVCCEHPTTRQPLVGVWRAIALGGLTVAECHTLSRDMQTFSMRHGRPIHWSCCVTYVVTFTMRVAPGPGLCMRLDSGLRRRALCRPYRACWLHPCG